jgi:phasin
MLSLYIRSFCWLAWWPVSAWLLTLEKAAESTAAAGSASPPREDKRGQVRQQESGMANDTFMKPEMPESMRDLMKMSIEQAKRAFDTFAATNEKTWKSLESSSQSAGAGLRSLNEKIITITRNTAEANFALALKLAETKDMGKALELQADYARKQMEQFVHQLEEIRDLAAEIIQESNPVRAETAPGSAPRPTASPSASSGGSKTYPSPSDFAPDRGPRRA